MAWVSIRELLKDAQKNKYALGAFNVENMEMIQAVVKAAEIERAPVILQTTPSTIKYADTTLFAAMAHAVAERCLVPVALHLDHGNKMDLCIQAAGDGYNSVMIDGSSLPLAENISLTRQVVEKISEMRERPGVEAELGRIGGKEDYLEVREDEEMYTDIDEAVRFVAETGIDSLAVAIGTAHGFYKKTPKLNFERLKDLRDAVSVPLVLHGASGISDNDVQKAVSLGICKVNFATELRAAYSQAVKTFIKDETDVYDPKKYGAAGREAVCEVVRKRIQTCMRMGKEN